MNIGCYKEAAEHFLGALSMHQRHNTGAPAGASAGAQEKNISITLWDTLRRAFYGMNRGDLAHMAQPSTSASLDVFRTEFDF